MRLHLSIAILLTTAIAVPQLRTRDSLLDSEQSSLSMSMLRRPPPGPEQLPLEGIAHDSSVSMRTYEKLKRFAKYASAVYQFLCPRPLGNTLVQSVSRPTSPRFLFVPAYFCVWISGCKFSNVLTHTHGFVVRDDRRREIVVAFRGSHELADMVTGTRFCALLWSAVAAVPTVSSLM